MSHKSWSKALVLALVLPLVGADALAEESKEDKIARAVSAAPSRVSAKATVVDLDGAVLREGTNGWTCLPGVMPGDTHPMCNDAVWMKAMKAMGDHSAFTTDTVGVSYMLQGDMYVNNADPGDKTPDPGEVWIQEGPHLMVIFPDRKELAGFPEDPSAGGPWVMWKDTPFAHVMVPLGAREK